MKRDDRCRRTEMSVETPDPDRDRSLTVDCGNCPGRAGPVDGGGFCEGCVVGFLLGREDDDAVVHDICEERALRLLAQSGMLREVVGRMGHVEAERRFASA